MRLPATLALLAAACIGVPATADCTKEPANLMAKANCGFDEKVAGWTGSEGAAVSHANDGAQGVMKAVADSGGSLTVMSPCMKARTAAAYVFSARIRKVTGTPYFCSLNVWQFTDDQCSEGQEPLGSDGLPPGDKWQAVKGSATTSAAAKSIQLWPTCSGEPAFAIQWDDFVLAQR